MVFCTSVIGYTIKSWLVKSNDLSLGRKQFSFSAQEARENSANTRMPYKLQYAA